MTELDRIDDDGQEHALPAVVDVRPAESNPYLVYVGGLDSAESRRTMTACLRQVAEMLGAGDPADVPWGAIRFQHVARLKAMMGERVTRRADGEAAPWSAATVNKHLSAIRGVARVAWELGQMSAEDYQRVKAVKGVRGNRLPAGRSVADAELAAMLSVCMDGTLTGARDGAVVALLASTGLRRAEVAGARVEHYDPGARSLRIVGKGNKEREVYVTEEAAAYLGAWLVKYKARTGPLFVPIDRWGRPARRHMTTRAVADVIDRVRERANLPKLTAHDFRRTFIGNMLDAGVDLATTQALVGHANPATTSRYDRRPAAKRKAAVARLRIPRPEDLAK